MNAASRYKEIPWGTRFFLNLRWKLTPYSKIAAQVPTRGKVLDLGCGHGLLALAMAAESADREVLGIDHDTARVAAARKAAEGLSNLQFDRGSVLSPPPGKFNAITLIDVMHYFPPDVQKQLLRGCYFMLEEGGVLLVREVDPEGKGAVSALNQLYEKIATATGFTRADPTMLHFRSPKDWTELLSGSGFDVRSEPCSSALFADILYVAKRKS